MSELKHNFANVELIDKLITNLQTNRVSFDMRCWDACICGRLMQMQGLSAQRLVNHTKWGAQTLGISHEAAEELFQANRKNERKIERRDAIRALRILRDEGVVDWERACGG